MGHDEVADGIENFCPVPVGVIHAGEQPGIFQCNRCVLCHRLQKLLILSPFDPFTTLFTLAKLQNERAISVPQ